MFKMVLLTLIELSVKSVFWIGANLYNGGHYLIYGPTKTKEQILSEKIDDLDSKYKELKSEYDNFKRIKENDNVQINY